MESTDQSMNHRETSHTLKQGRTERKAHEDLQVSAPFGSTAKSIGLGLTLPKEARELLAKAKIAANSAVSIVKKGEPARYLLRGLDSGGGLGEVGHFVGYSSVKGVQLEIRHVFDNCIPNQVHALVFAPAFLRTEVFRFRQTYSLSVSFYMLLEAAGAQPTISERVLFRGRNGRLDTEAGLTRTGVPVFVDMSGNTRRPQELFHGVLAAALNASQCNACTHDHFKDIPAVDLSPLLGAKWMTQLPARLSAAIPPVVAAATAPIAKGRTARGPKN